MKKFFSFAFIAMSVIGSLTSCHDEDLDVSTAVLQEHAFEQGFIKEFGKPSANQSWDFYTQLMQSLRKEGATRATMDDPVIDTSIGQGEMGEWLTAFSANIKNNILKDGVNNSATGQSNFSLVSTGEFKIYAVHYGGAIEHDSGYDFHFGIGYYDENGNPTEVEMFDDYTEGDTDQNNPGYGAKVNLAPGTKFYFYITYINNHTYRYRSGGNNTSWHSRNAEYETCFRKYYTNANPSAPVHKTHNWSNAGNNPNWNNNIETNTYLNYPGAATLLYSTENDGKQYMIIGFEDAWHLGCPGNPDLDYNDIIFVLEGQLPVPTSKRFFCEDLQSYDWDYNDVVFDVTSRGVVLRAVGGTLPVYLEITDKKGVTHRYGELHKLMWEGQTDEEKRKHPYYHHEIEIEGNKGDYYIPIRVGANPGLPIEAVQLGPVWNYEDMDDEHTFDGEGLALTDEEVIAFANPMAANPVGGVKLIVYRDIDSRRIVEEDGQQVDNSGFQVIEVPGIGQAPAIWSAPASVAWMIEMQKITNAYPDFYGRGKTDDPSTGGMPIWWGNVNPADTYTFSGDVDPYRQN